MDYEVASSPPPYSATYRDANRKCLLFTICHPGLTSLIQQSINIDVLAEVHRNVRLYTFSSGLGSCPDQAFHQTPTRLVQVKG